MLNLALPSNAMTFSDAMEGLTSRPASRLVFVADDLLIDGSYHVTEIKSGNFVSLDCGGNPESWAETVLQIEMTADSGGPNTMDSEKLTGILRKVADKVGLAPDSRLTIEAGTAGQPMRVYDVGDIRDSGGSVVVRLFARPALCKPRHREIVHSVANACCAPSARQKEAACCAAN